MNVTQLAIGIPLTLALVGCTTVKHERSSGKYVKLDYPASAASNELQIAVTYTMWIPDGVTTLRGIIVHQHGAGTTASIEGATAAYDWHWQALERKWNCALWGSSYHVQNEKIDSSPGASELWFDPRRGSEKTFLKALTDVAAKSNHPEINRIPSALWGHSGGGIWSDVITTLHPQRAVAVWMRSGSKPMDTGKAWLAPLFGDEAKPAAEFKGNADEAVWLPNETVDLFARNSGFYLCGQYHPQTIDAVLHER